MAENIEHNLIQLLGGTHFDELTSELCDFTLEEQNAAAEAQGVQPSASSNFQPVLGRTVTYIVACVIINEHDEVLMMQEAKESCAGTWYLPAGRMEKDEQIVDAAVREVYEETGLNIEVKSLLAVECAGGSWFRFVMTGIVLNGELKTPARADKESLQAKWISNMNELSLRSKDILPLIDLAVIKKRCTNRAHVLVSEKNSYHFPTVEVHPNRSVHATLRKFLIELFGAELPQHRPQGILSVEHCPSENGQNDGICMTVLVAFRPALEDVSLLGKCIWQELSKEIDERLIAVVSGKNSTLPLHVVR
ncbi:hypothetical protein HA402_005789 [Bradysia odoriphaga]|nr:hypothetical protein HA402_005789 [Bradysia odoriphaga]